MLNPEFLPKKEFMLEAISLARQAALEGEIPVGAVVELNGQIIGRGRNRREQQNNPLGHGEIEAISQACAALGDWRLKGANLYVTLEPCPMCAGAAINSRIKRIIFGAWDQRAGCCGSLTNLCALSFCHKPALYPGFFEQECAKLLKDFFTAIR